MRKISLLGVVKRYFSTLTDGTTGRIMPIDVAVQIVFPGIIGAGLFFFYLPEGSEYQLVSRCLGQFASGVTTTISLVSALLSAVSVLIFQLRVQLLSQKDPVPSRDEVLLVDQMFDQVLWDVLVGIVAVVLFSIFPVLSVGTLIWRLVLSASLAVTANYVMVMCMCIKRFSEAYRIVSTQWRPKGW